MSEQTNFGGSFTLPNTSIILKRIGYGAMQLAGKGVFGPPRDLDAAIAVFREAVAIGINHIDTSDFYGPHITNQIIRQALHPYPDDLLEFRLKASPRKTVLAKLRVKKVTLCQGGKVLEKKKRSSFLN